MDTRRVPPSEHLPPEHLRPIIELTSGLEDLNLGKRSELMTPAPRLDEDGETKEGSAGRTTQRTLDLAAACACMDALPKDQEEVVARKVGLDVGPLRSWNKKLKAGYHGLEAAAAYDAVMSELWGQPHQTCA